MTVLISCEATTTTYVHLFPTISERVDKRNIFLYFKVVVAWLHRSSTSTGIVENAQSTNGQEMGRISRLYII